MERLELTAWQTAALQRALGAAVDVPVIGAMRQEFDEWLLSDPAHSVWTGDPLAIALGVAS